jgi:uncharacterized membrane protein HdeD (DUF308 family)
MLFPASALFAFSMLFAAFAFVDGLLSVFSGVAGVKENGQWALILRGLVGILVGGLFVLMPYVATISYAVISLALLALWSIFAGVLEITAAARLRNEIRGEWLLGISGFLSILLGLAIPVLLALVPAATLLSAAWMIAIYALAAGGVLIADGLKRNHGLGGPTRAGSDEGAPVAEAADPAGSTA